MRIGFDIGGTKTEVCVLDDNGKQHFSQRTATPQNYTDFLMTLCELIRKAEQETQRANSIGIGLPGAISPATGLIKNANCTFLNGRDLKADLNAMSGREIAIANDANCFALSEAVDGAGRDSQVVFGAILGTGCGGGIVVNKQLLIGANAVCGEWGHNPLPGFSREIDGENRPCYCGRNNCIEQFISGTGLQNSYRLSDGQSLPAAEIIRKYRSGDPSCTRVYHTLIEHMARSFASVVNLLDPDIIVLGGGLSNVDELYRDLPQVTAKYVFSDTATIHFAKATFGDSSGIRGAAWLGRR